MLDTQGNRTPDYDIGTRNKGRNIKTRHMLEANEMKVLRKIVGNRQNKKPTVQRILRYPPINEWVERRRREWGEHVTRMDAERLVKI